MTWSHSLLDFKLSAQLLGRCGGLDLVDHQHV